MSVLAILLRAACDKSPDLADNPGRGYQHDQRQRRQITPNASLASLQQAVANP